MSTSEREYLANWPLPSEDDHQNQIRLTSHDVNFLDNSPIGNQGGRCSPFQQYIAAGVEADDSYGSSLDSLLNYLQYGLYCNNNEYGGNQFAVHEPNTTSASVPINQEQFRREENSHRAQDQRGTLHQHRHAAGQALSRSDTPQASFSPTQHFDPNTLEGRGAGRCNIPRNHGSFPINASVGLSEGNSNQRLPHSNESPNNPPGHEVQLPRHQSKDSSVAVGVGAATAVSKDPPTNLPSTAKGSDAMLHPDSSAKDLVKALSEDDRIKEEGSRKDGGYCVWWLELRNALRVMGEELPKAYRIKLSKITADVLKETGLTVKLSKREKKVPTRIKTLVWVYCEGLSREDHESAIKRIRQANPEFIQANSEERQEYLRDKGKTKNLIKEILRLTLVDYFVSKRTPRTRRNPGYVTTKVEKKSDAPQDIKLESSPNHKSRSVPRQKEDIKSETDLYSQFIDEIDVATREGADEGIVWGIQIGLNIVLGTDTAPTASQESCPGCTRPSAKVLQTSLCDECSESLLQNEESLRHKIPPLIEELRKQLRNRDSDKSSFQYFLRELNQKTHAYFHVTKKRVCEQSRRRQAQSNPDLCEKCSQTNTPSLFSRQDGKTTLCDRMSATKLRGGYRPRVTRESKVVLYGALTGLVKLLGDRGQDELHPCDIILGHDDEARHQVGTKLWRQQIEIEANNLIYSQFPYPKTWGSIAPAKREKAANEVMEELENHRFVIVVDNQNEARYQFRELAEHEVREKLNLAIHDKFNLLVKKIPDIPQIHENPQAPPPGGAQDPVVPQAPAALEDRVAHATVPILPPSPVTHQAPIDLQTPPPGSLQNLIFHQDPTFLQDSQDPEMSMDEISIRKGSSAESFASLAAHTSETYDSTVSSFTMEESETSRSSGAIKINEQMYTDNHQACAIKPAKENDLKSKARSIDDENSQVEFQMQPEIHSDDTNKATLYSCRVCGNFKLLSYTDSNKPWIDESVVFVPFSHVMIDNYKICSSCSKRSNKRQRTRLKDDSDGSGGASSDKSSHRDSNKPKGSYDPSFPGGAGGGGFPPATTGSAGPHGPYGNFHHGSSAVDSEEPLGEIEAQILPGETDLSFAALSSLSSKTAIHPDAATNISDSLVLDLPHSDCTGGGAVFSVARRNLPSPDLNPGSKHRAAWTATHASDVDEGGQLLSTLSHHELVARDDALGIVEESYDLITAEGSEVSQLLRIYGPSGCGKSALMKASMDRIKDRNHFYLETKSDQLRQQAPHAALLQMSRQLCQQILTRDSKDEILERMRDKFGPETNGLLGKLAPTLATEMASPQQQNETFTEAVAVSEPVDATQTQLHTNESSVLKTRFKLLFRTLLQCAASSREPLILFLDDLQWIDQPSLEVLMSLTTDKQSKNMLIVMAYREDQTAGSVLEQFDLFKSERSSDNEELVPSTSTFNEVDVPLVNLDLESLNVLVASAMNTDTLEAADLSMIVFNKTDGNPFYALSFLDQLVSLGLLVRKADKWDWDEGEISEIANNNNNNLATLLTNKVQRLPDHVRSILQIASCLGFDFSIEVLVNVIYEEQNMEDTPYTVQRHSREIIRERTIQALSVAVKERLLEKDSGKDRCKFSHDKIQLVLYESLMPPEEEDQKRLRHRIGMSLWKSKPVDENMVFLAADCINQGLGVVDYSIVRYELVELNMRASQIALDRAAFQTAANFLRSALELLEGELSWSIQHKLCVELHMSSASAELLVGNFTGAKRIVERLLANTRSEEDRMAAKIMGVNIKLAESDIQGSLEDGFEILREAGTISLRQKVPFSRFVVRKELIATKKALGWKSMEELVALKPITDVKKQLTIKLMVIMCNTVFFAGEEYKNTFAAICLRITRFMVQNGVAGGEACVAFAACAMVYAILGWYDKALKMEQLALHLSEKLGPNSSEGWTYCLCKSFVFPWRNRITPDLRDGFLHSYRLSRIEGDSAHVHLSFYSWMVSGLYLNTPLSELIRRTRSLVEEAEEANEDLGSTLVPIVVLWQLASNLRSINDVNQARLEGEAMDAQRIEKMDKEPLPIVIFIRKRYERDLAFLYEDWDFIVEISLPYYKTNDAAGPTTHFAGAFGQVMHALALYEIAFRKDRSVWKEARRAHRVVEKWATGGALFLSGANKLLNAMRAMCHPRQLVPLQKIEELFAVADRDLSRHHCVFLQAIANERLAQYCRGVKADNKYYIYMTKCIELYEKMEAWAKVKWLKDRWQTLLPIS